MTTTTTMTERSLRMKAQGVVVERSGLGLVVLGGYHPAYPPHQKRARTDTASDYVRRRWKGEAKTT